jgi:hypothetical protein
MGAVNYDIRVLVLENVLGVGAKFAQWNQDVPVYLGFGMFLRLTDVQEDYL